MNEKETGVNIRPMSDVDIPNILAIEKLITTGQQLLSEKDLYANNPRSQLYHNYVAEVGGNIIGAIFAHIGYIMIPVTEVCIIHGFFVHPGFRNRHIGSQLIKTLLDYCRTEEINTIRAHVPQYNNELIGFFERLGFHSSNIINMDKTFET